MYCCSVGLSFFYLFEDLSLQEVRSFLFKLKIENKKSYGEDLLKMTPNKTISLQEQYFASDTTSIKM